MPDQNEINLLFKRARGYQANIIKVKKDVTYAENQAEIMNNLSNYDEKRAASQELFESIDDVKKFQVSKMTKSS